MYSSHLVVLAAIFVTSQWTPVSSHGRLWTPAGRATMWKRGFDTPTNFNDNQMFCGGLHHQMKQGYKCGLCGDPYDSDRPHEAGGKYATGTIAATYTQGQEVVLEVDLTANHKGWFEFKLCPTNDYTKKATQECLDQRPLQLSDGSGTRLDVSRLGSAMVSIPVRLPDDLTCDLCMLQWRYHCGNNWGGFTAQEEFYGCADIKILPKDQSKKSKQTPPTLPPKPETTPGQAPNTGRPIKETTRLRLTTRRLSTRQPVTSSKPGSTRTETTSPTKLVKTTGRPTPFIPPHPDKPHIFDNIKPRLTLKCKAVRKVKGLDAWCAKHCPKGSCPASHCKCRKVLALPSDL